MSELLENHSALHEVTPTSGRLRAKTIVDRSALLAAVAVGLTLWSWQVVAQPAGQPGTAGAAGTSTNSATGQASDQTLQEVIVTGSYIPRTDTETPSPVQVITAGEIHESGYTSISQVLNDLPANGQGTLSQSFSGAFASGAAGIALRGLNVVNTLVLIDGHRQAPYPLADDGYRSFVDVANLPFEAVDHIDVLKDGASAIYGSDAIAGVVNIVLRKTYEGAEVTADGGVSGHGDGWQQHYSGIVGHGDLDSDGYNAFLSAEYRQQDPIFYYQRGGSFEDRNYTSEGGIDASYGASNILNGGLPPSATGYITNAAGAIAGFMPGCNAAKFAANQCTYEDTWDQIQPPTRNLNLLGRFTQKMSDNWTWDFEGGYFQSWAEQENRPDQPVTADAYANGYQGIAFGPGIGPTLLAPVPAPTIPDTNPTFPTGTGLTSGKLYYTMLNLGAGGVITQTDSSNVRAVFDLDGKIGGWTIDGSLGYTGDILELTGLNYISVSNLQTALNSTTAPFLVGEPNSAAVDNFVAPPLRTSDTSKLGFLHLGATDQLAKLPGGPLGLAFGTDVFTWDEYAVAPPQVQSGIQATGDFSNAFAIGTEHVQSGYLELDAPVIQQFEADAAVRYDHYNESGGRASPKLGLKYTPFTALAFRGTLSSGFRAPGPGENGQAGESFFAGTLADPVLCPNPKNPSAAGNFAGECVLSVPGLEQSNPKLQNETSKEWTLGLVVQPLHDLSATFDWYSIEIDHQIVPGSAAGVGQVEIVRGTNFTPLPEYQSNGSTVLTTPPVAPIAYLGETYINANTTKTSGFDLGVQYKHRFDFGTISSSVNWTYIATYDLTVGGVTYELVGTHGPTFYSGDTGNPASRVQWSTTFSQPSWSITGTLNYTDGYKDIDTSIVAFGYPPQGTCLQALADSGGFAGTVFANELAAGVIPAQVGCTVGDFITYDLYGVYNITSHLNLHASAINVFNEHAPLDYVTYGGALGAVPWNPSLHYQGAVGQFFNLGATYKF